MLALDGGFSVIIFNMTDSILLTFLFAIVFGAFCGLVNGVMVGLVEMPQILSTLGVFLLWVMNWKQKARKTDRRQFFLKNCRLFLAIL